MTNQPQNSTDWTRRAVLATAAAGVASTALARDGHADAHKGLDLGYDADTGRYTLPPLPYAHDALEPAIDEQTMRLHHGKHHAGYVRGLNNALDQLAAIRAGEGDPKLIKHWSREVGFHGGGHVNHTLFWSCMAPPDQAAATLPAGRLAELINRDFGSLDALKNHFVAASAAVEASGWGWLAWEPLAGRLLVLQMEKQQDMLMTGAIPLFGVDVWEHAYYLNYQNRRSDYIKAFWTLINWDWANRRLMSATT